MSVTAGSAPRSVGSRPVWTPAPVPVHAVARLRRVQRYAPYRRLLGPVAHRRIVLSLGAVATQLAAVVLPVVGRVLAQRLTPATTGTLLVLASAGACVLGARRALSTQSRTRVTDPADAGLLQALDLHAPEVFWVFAARPALRWHVGVLAASAALALGASTVGTVWWSLLAVPLGSAVLTTGLAARLACRPVVARAALRTLALQATPAAALGALGARGVAATLARGTLVVQDSVACTILTGTGLVTALAVMTGVVLVVDALPRLRAMSWNAAGPSRRGRSGATTERARMRTMVTGSPLAASVLGIWRAVVLASAVGAGVVLGGASLPPGARGVVGPLLTGYAFVTVLVASGVVFSVVGPSAMIDRLRFRWEISSAGAPRIAAQALAYPLAVVVTPSALLAVAQSILLSQVSARTLALGIALVGSAVIAESVLPVARHADGTTTHHPLASWVVLLVSLPAAALPAGVVGSLLSTGYALIVLGAGHRCLTRRILRLPSSSAA